MGKLTDRIKQILGQSTTDLVSQKTVTDAISAETNARIAADNLIKQDVIVLQNPPTWDVAALARLKTNSTGSFDGCNFQGANFAGVVFNNTSFIGANLTGVNFTGVILQGSTNFLNAITDMDINDILNANVNWNQSLEFVQIIDEHGILWQVNANIALSGANNYGSNYVYKGLHLYAPPTYYAPV